MSNSLSDKEKKIVGTVLAKHLADDKSASVLLFGSMASQTANPKSDIDIAIKSSGPLEKSKWVKIEADFEESDLSRKVDVVDYHRVVPDFQKVIDQQGIILMAPKSHPYRICPTDHHWVRTHDRRIPPSLVHPDGYIADVDGHCRQNKGALNNVREVLTPDEIVEIFNRFGNESKAQLKTFKDKGKSSWNKLDQNIWFWTKFWNEVFQPKIPLDANVVKALIGSESSFRMKPDPQNAGGAGMARGLIQLTDQALEVMSKKGELSDYLMSINEEDLMDPDVSIAGGIRWLFHKKRLADAALKRDASWDEAILNYKGYLKEHIHDPNKKFKGFQKFQEAYAELFY